MKKYLYLLPLLVLILIPKNVFAFVVPPNDYKNYYVYPIGITSEQKQFMLDSVMSDENYISYSEVYPYHIIIYKTGNIPYQYNYSGHYALVIYFNEIPEIKSTFDQYMTIESSEQAKVIEYSFDFDNNTFIYGGNYSLGELTLFTHNASYKADVGEYGTYLASYLDFYLYSNFNLKPLWNFNLYDLDSNLIKTYTTEDDLFNFEKEEEKKEYTIEDILNSDDILYSLSKELIGSLPEEFSFIYSIVALMLGILVLIVVISPFVLLKRWLM